MIYIELCGGLGNQLFQIFCGISYAYTNNIEFRIKSTKPCNVSQLDHISKRGTYWKNILSELSKFTYNNTPKLFRYKEPMFTFKLIPNNKNDFIINGFFQSYKYFESQYDKILKLIKIEEQKIVIKEKYKEYFSSEVISIHFRLGDFKYPNKTHVILELDYYINSLIYILNNTNEKYSVLVFSEEVDDELIKTYIDKISKKFENIKIVQCSYNIADWEQMLLMSCCKHNIIANSTFSWWGAYFNNYPEKIVCYPKIWFRPTKNISTKDLFPENWVKIE